MARLRKHKNHIPRRLPDVLSPQEREALLRQPNKKAPTGFRNYIMMRLMLNIGLRVSEVLKLEVRDVDLNTGKTWIRQAKGNRDRILWLQEDDLELLRQWRERKPSSRLYFTTLHGTPLDQRYVRAMVARQAEKAGIQAYYPESKEDGRAYQKSRVHPHTLRHTFATDLLKETKNLRLVQKALGHTSISTTEIYTHIVDEELETALRSFRGNGAQKP